jgi:hypothetical protein
MFFSADGKTLLVAGPNLVGYEVSSGKELFSWRMEPAESPMEVPGVTLTPWRALAISPREMLIAAVRADEGFHRQRLGGRIVLYDPRSGKVLRRWNDSNPNGSHRLERLAFSRDGTLLASSAGDVIHLWEVATGQEVRTLRGHRGEVMSLAFSGDDRRLASGGEDSTVLLWDLTGQSTDTAPAAEAVEQYWKALGRHDARRAYQAGWALARMPERSLALLRDRLRPVKPVNREQIDRWIKELDSDQFAVREQAVV